MQMHYKEEHIARFMVKQLASGTVQDPLLSLPVSLFT